jgi:alcohol dehydrogenase
VGARVAASYGHRTHAIIPEAKAMVVPEYISDAQALPVILSCDVAKGIRKAAITYDEPVLVTGAGAIGLLTIFMLRALGIQTIDVVEPLEARRELALDLGATTAFTPQQMHEHGRRYPVAFECSSRNVAFGLIQTKMQAEGRICVLADGNLEPLVLAPGFHTKELRVIGSSDGWDYQAHAAWYFKLIGQGSSPIERIFDYLITRDQLSATFESLAGGVIAPVKVFVRYE